MSKRYKWTEEAHERLWAAAEAEWSGDRMPHGGWARVADAIGGGMCPKAARSQFYLMRKATPGSSLAAPVLQRLNEWFDIVGDEKWDADGAEALVTELHDDFEFEFTVKQLLHLIYYRSTD